MNVITDTATKPKGTITPELATVAVKGELEKAQKAAEKSFVIGLIDSVMKAVQEESPVIYQALTKDRDSIVPMGYYAESHRFSELFKTLTCLSGNKLELGQLGELDRILQKHSLSGKWNNMHNFYSIVVGQPDNFSASDYKILFDGREPNEAEIEAYLQQNNRRRLAVHPEEYDLVSDLVANEKFGAAPNPNAEFSFLGARQTQARELVYNLYPKQIIVPDPSMLPAVIQDIDNISRYQNIANKLIQDFLAMNPKTVTDVLCQTIADYNPDDQQRRLYSIGAMTASILELGEAVARIPTVRVGVRRLGPSHGPKIFSVEQSNGYYDKLLEGLKALSAQVSTTQIDEVVKRNYSRKIEEIEQNIAYLRDNEGKYVTGVKFLQGHNPRATTRMLNVLIDGAVRGDYTLMWLCVPYQGDENQEFRVKGYQTWVDKKDVFPRKDMFDKVPGLSERPYDSDPHINRLSDLVLVKNSSILA